MPDSKGIKVIIHTAYNYTFNTLVSLLQPITSVSLTLDLWTYGQHEVIMDILASRVHILTSSIIFMKLLLLFLILDIHIH
jgi:hypothetical protein